MVLTSVLSVDKFTLQIEMTRHNYFFTIIATLGSYNFNTTTK